MYRTGVCARTLKANRLLISYGRAKSAKGKKKVNLGRNEKVYKVRRDLHVSDCHGPTNPIEAYRVPTTRWHTNKKALHKYLHISFSGFLRKSSFVKKKKKKTKRRKNKSPDELFQK